jgi:hypothetical protein
LLTALRGLHAFLGDELAPDTVSPFLGLFRAHLDLVAGAPLKVRPGGSGQHSHKRHD